VGSDPQAIILASVAALRDKVNALGAENVAAFFCEPIQGSGGVIVPPVGWLKAMREACRELDILFVADEVITGFGRTGPMFACEAEGVSPDLMTVAKGLTSGYAPMGALLISERVYAGIADGTSAGARRRLGQRPRGGGSPSTRSLRNGLFFRIWMPTASFRLQADQCRQAVNVADFGEAPRCVRPRLMTTVDEHLVHDPEVLGWEDVVPGVG